MKWVKISSLLNKQWYDEIYNGTIQSLDIKKDIWEAYYQRLRQFAEAGAGRSMNSHKSLDEFLRFSSYKKNMSAFAALKNQRATEELIALTKLPYKDFVKKAKVLLDVHNNEWLHTEAINNALAAQKAEKWQNYERRKGVYPNLKYVTVGDSRVREEHDALNGMIRSVDDPIWDKLAPPNGHRCRCDLSQTDAPVNKVKADIEATKGFRHNPGKSNILTSEDHPYFDVSPRDRKNLETKGEKLREAMERKEIRKIARDLFAGKLFDLAGLKDKLEITGRGIDRAISSHHPAKALKNDLLLALDKIIPILEKSKEAGDVVHYVIELLDESFLFEFAKKDGKYFLNAITKP